MARARTHQRDESQVFVPSTAFPLCVGFFVRAQVETVHGGEGLALMQAYEPDGYGVYFAAPRDKVEVGQTLDIPGHAILAYSGVQGPWGLGDVREPVPA